MNEEGDSRLFQGMDADVLKQRSRHDSIVPVEVRTGIKREVRQQCLRIASEAALRAMLEREGVERAFDEVKAAYDAIAGSQGVKAQDYSQNHGKGIGGGTAGEMLARYIGWGRVVQQSRLDHAMAIDTIVFGLSLRQVDFARRVRKGQAAINLIAVLKLW